MKNASVIILAGGRSERMNAPKPFLLIRGRTFIQRIAEVYHAFGVKEVLVVLNSEFVRHFDASSKWLQVVLNPCPEYGRLFSLQLGLSQLRSMEQVFIHNVDSPFVEQEVLKRIWDNRSPDRYVVPVHGGRRGHPVLIPENIARTILGATPGIFTLREVLSYYKRSETEVSSGRILSNINTWKDYESEVLSVIPESSYG